MNKATCWYCKKEFEYDNDQHRDVDCPHCGIENSIYKQAEKKENQMILAKYIKASDCTTGDTLKFCNEGEWVESRFKYDDGEPKQQLQFLVEDKDGNQLNFAMNKTNRDALISGWGIDTKAWIDKTAQITIKEIEVAGKDTMVIRLEPLS